MARLIFPSQRDSIEITSASRSRRPVARTSHRIDIKKLVETSKYRIITARTAITSTPEALTPDAPHSRVSRSRAVEDSLIVTQR
jgi:hypothetical protein